MLNQRHTTMPPVPMEYRPGPDRETQCPFFFDTNVNGSSNFNTLGGDPNSFGPGVDSTHYQVTFQRTNWGGNTWVQLRFYNNVQDSALENVRFCVAATNWNPEGDIRGGSSKNEPKFTGRVKASPHVPAGDLEVTTTAGVTTPYFTKASSMNCVTISQVKAKGWQKVKK